MSEQPETIRITADRLYAELQRRAGEWATRRELARALERRGERLNPFDLASLELLIAEGKVIAERRPMGGAIGYEVRYTARR